MDTLEPGKTRILVVGLGLMGGSYAQGLAAAGFEVGALDPSQAALDLARSRGWIAHGRTAPDADFVGAADLVVFALYPHIFVDWIRQHQALLKPGALLTDTTGVKGAVVGEVQQLLRPDVEFIAAHPMAGCEKSGIEHADASIFRGANYIVTPTPKNSPRAIEQCKRLGEVLGFANLSVLPPADHDEMIAYVSQLTHCIAVALMDCEDVPNMARYTGDSFRDLTRIADINDGMWAELFLANRLALLHQMGLFEATFARLRAALEAGDTQTLRAMMRLSTARRRAFNAPRPGRAQNA